MSDTVPFGKYKGRPVEDMLADAEYMAWLEAQPWFRERFKHLMARRDEEAMSRTPTHNRLQALFLEEAYCLAFTMVADPDCWKRAERRRPEEGDCRRHVAALFEHNGADVRIRCAYLPSAWSEAWISDWRRGGVLGISATLPVEIKPTVGDEYPAVLRQMARNGSKYLFLERYVGEGATEAQFVAMFAASDKKVVFKRDVDAMVGELRSA